MKNPLQISIARITTPSTIFFRMQFNSLDVTMQPGNVRISRQNNVDVLSILCVLGVMYLLLEHSPLDIPKSQQLKIFNLFVFFCNDLQGSIV